MLHDKTTISQSLARGFDLCGRRGGGATGGGAGERCSRATGPNFALRRLASRLLRFAPRLLHPPGNPAHAGRVEPAKGDGRLPLGPWNCPHRGLGGPLLSACTSQHAPPRTCARPGWSGGQVALWGEGRRQDLNLVARCHGQKYLL